MDMPTYDPAVAANLLSAIALIVAIASLRQSRRTAKTTEEAKLPDVTSEGLYMREFPGWLRVISTCKNNSPSSLEISTIKITLPLWANGISEIETWQAGTDIYGNQIRLAELPDKRARREIDVSRILAPSGSSGDTFQVEFYVKVEGSLFVRALRFSISFSLRKTDVRRFNRTVSPQIIKLPRRQTD